MHKIFENRNTEFSSKHRWCPFIFLREETIILTIVFSNRTEQGRLLLACLICRNSRLPEVDLWMIYLFLFHARNIPCCYFMRLKLMHEFHYRCAAPRGVAHHIFLFFPPSFGRRCLWGEHCCALCVTRANILLLKYKFSTENQTIAMADAAVEKK